MNKDISSMVRPVTLAVGLTLMLGAQACGEKKLAEEAPGKAMESAAPAPAAGPAEANANAGAASTADESSSREAAPAAGSK